MDKFRMGGWVQLRFACCVHRTQQSLRCRSQAIARCVAPTPERRGSPGLIATAEFAPAHCGAEAPMQSTSVPARGQTTGLPQRQEFGRQLVRSAWRVGMDTAIVARSEGVVAKGVVAKYILLRRPFRRQTNYATSHDRRNHSHARRRGWRERLLTWSAMPRSKKTWPRGGDHLNIFFQDCLDIPLCFYPFSVPASE